MSKTLYCRACRWGLVVTAGKFPRQCPACDRDARWTTVRPVRPALVPSPSYAVTYMDRRFLKAIGIDPA